MELTSAEPTNLNQKNTVTLDKIVALCKRRGFAYPSADIYGGLNGVYDMGPIGTLLKNNIRAAWINSLKKLDKDILFMEGALLGSEPMWQASGHVSNFHDPLVDCLVCKKRYRADDVNLEKPCPNCGNTSWTDVRQFHLMFKTQVGAATDQSSTAYLRPETAQSIFVNFKNIMTTNRVKIPFGVGQIGKAFRNEITPKQFLFRMREFEQMELEWFCKGETALEFFAFWSEERMKFYKAIGLNMSNIRLRAHEKEELSHYSSATSDVEYQFPFGWKELEGVAYRGNFDLTQHSKCSGKDLAVFDDETKASYTPHVVECSVGVDRLFLTILFDSYCEEPDNEGVRTVLKLHPSLAPVKAAVLPLVKAQAEGAEKLYRELKKLGFEVQYDLSGSIGKRYRRQDEIGTPVCFTYDFETENDHCVTARQRDSMTQERISLDKVGDYLKNLVK